MQDLHKVCARKNCECCRFCFLALRSCQSPSANNNCPFSLAQAVLLSHQPSPCVCESFVSCRWELLYAPITNRRWTLKSESPSRSPRPRTSLRSSLDLRTGPTPATGLETRALGPSGGRFAGRGWAPPNFHHTPIFIFRRALGNEGSCLCLTGPFAYTVGPKCTQMCRACSELRSVGCAWLCHCGVSRGHHLEPKRRTCNFCLHFLPLHGRTGRSFHGLPFDISWALEHRVTYMLFGFR